MHHFGSVTQSAMKKEMRIAANKGLGARNNKNLLNQTWLERKWLKARRNALLRKWRREELADFGMTMHGVRENDVFRWN